jgi:GTP-binding protein YchF
MKVHILGLPQAGQQEFFSLLTGVKLDLIRLKPLEIHPGVCEVKDPRIQKLSEMYRPKKTIYARIEYFLLPDFASTGPAKALIFSELRKTDEICWVARSENAQAEIADFVSEMILNDLAVTEKRIETLEHEQRRKFLEAKEKEKALMNLCKKELENETPLRQITFNPEDLKTIRGLNFLTLKPWVFVINVPEDQPADDSSARKISEKYGYPCLQVSAGLEEEISRLGESERKEFMKEMGIAEPALHRMTRLVFDGLGLISFFTVGEDEVRAWPIRKNSHAPEAGGAVHSDIEKGFIRAELIKYNDLITLGTEAKVKEAGKFSLKGKDYLVEDGDVLNFRFNT